MNTLFQRFLKNIQTAGGFTDYETALLRYSISTFLSESSKLISYFIIFSLLGKRGAYLCALCVLMSLRPLTGGLHCKHYLSCFALSFLILAAAVYLPELLPLDYRLGLSAIVLCMAAVYFCAPVVSKNRPACPLKKQMFFKWAAMAVMGFCLILFFLFRDNPYTFVGIWTIILQTLQLAIAKLLTAKTIKRRFYYHVKLFKKSACSLL